MRRFKHGASSPAWHEPLCCRGGTLAWAGQAEIKEMQVGENGDKKGEINVRAQTEALSVQPQGRHQSCHHKLSHNLIPRTPLGNWHLNLPLVSGQRSCCCTESVSLLRAITPRCPGQQHGHSGVGGDRKQRWGQQTAAG